MQHSTCQSVLWSGSPESNVPDLGRLPWLSISHEEGAGSYLAPTGTGVAPGITSCGASGWSGLNFPSSLVSRLHLQIQLCSQLRGGPSLVGSYYPGAQPDWQAQPPGAAPTLHSWCPRPPQAASCSSLLSPLQLFLWLSSVPAPHRTLDRVRLLGCGWGLCSAGLSGNLT